MKKWYIAFFVAFIILAGCGTEDDGAMDEGSETNPQSDVETDDRETNNQENGTQNGEGENGTSNGETAYDRGGEISNWNWISRIMINGNMNMR